MQKNVTVVLSLLALLGLFSHSVWAEKIYKCKNQKGVLIYSSSPCAKDVESINSWTVVAKEKKPEVLNITQDNSGHYFVPGKVNDQTLTFVVDTGASVVSLPNQIAQAAQLTCGETINLQTANGNASACKVVIPKFTFGPFTLNDVDAVIAPNLSQPLLGMNVLQQYKIAQDHGQMHISER